MRYNTYTNMLIAEHIAAIRGLIKGYSETDTPYTDQFLYHLFTTAAARLIKQREEKNHKQSDWNTPLYPVALEAGVIHGLGCIKGCSILKSKNKIPKPVTARNKDLLKVFTLGMKELHYINPSDGGVVNYDRIYKNQLHYSIVNEYLYIWNGDASNIVPRMVLVSGYFTDPSDWSNVISCDDNGVSTDTPCFNISTSDYPLDDDLAYPAYQLVLQALNITIQLREDRKNENAG